MRAGARRLGEFLGLRRSIAGVLGMAVLLEMGEKLAERFLPLYLKALGGGDYSIGLLNGLDNLLSALYSLPGGYLAARLGPKRALLFFDLLAMLGYLVVILAPGWVALILGAVLFISWSAISLPATMEVIARALPPAKQTMGVSLHSLVRRVPMALGPLIGGWCITAYGVQAGVRLAFCGALGLAIVAAILQQWLIADAGGLKLGGKTAEAVRQPPLQLYRQMPGSLRRLLASDILIRFCEQIPYAFVVIWCMQVARWPVTALQFGLLTSIEMATAMLVYIPVAAWADRTARRPFVIATFVFFTLFPVALMYSQSFPLLVGAFVLRGLKEFGEPARKALILQLAPLEMKGLMFGLYYLIRDVIVSAAAFGGAFLWHHSPQLNLLTAAGCGLAGTLWFALSGRVEKPATLARR